MRIVPPCLEPWFVSIITVPSRSTAFANKGRLWRRKRKKSNRWNAEKVYQKSVRFCGNLGMCEVVIICSMHRWRNIRQSFLLQKKSFCIKKWVAYLVIYSVIFMSLSTWENSSLFFIRFLERLMYAKYWSYNARPGWEGRNAVPTAKSLDLRQRMEPSLRHSFCFNWKCVS